MGLPSSSPDPSVDPDAEFIYAVLQILHTLFENLTQSFSRPLITSIHVLEPSSFKSPLGSEVYILTAESPPQTLLQGTQALCTEFSPQLVDQVGARMVEKLQKAYMKGFLCDTSLEAFETVLRNQLALVGAKVEWLVIQGGLVGGFGFAVARQDDEAKKILKNGKEGKDKKNRKSRKRIEKLYQVNSDRDHSVFQVTSRNGTVYIADFTFEQFGFDGKDWFLPRDLYVERYAQNRELQLFTEGDRMELDGIAYDRNWLGHVWEFCEKSLDWEFLVRLRAEKRVEEVTRAARESWGLMEAGRVRMCPV
ncbi:hypothetical protein DM02DRAFT_652817 [Periconia macrospinosa]|uniref:Uncharacterized protein n=1 Tax=Periconia macrospinosa TaxID=97972 RepID=A0A2V1DYB2_9PLEO|nr:hypothetical protein DM02DRAFT_652817 [Periconia macrospinosa]